MLLTLAILVSSAALQPAELDAQLLDAARDGDAREVRRLLEAGADVEATIETETPKAEAPEEFELNEDAGATPLILAATHGHAATVALLVEHGANVDARDASDFTALDRAAFAGHLDVIARLLADGARVPAGSHAVAWAARQGNRGVVQALLDAGGDPNVRLPMGWTALMFAAESGETAIVSDLLAAGADPNAVSMNGYTALRSAQQRGHEKIVELLEEAGAKH